MPAIYDSYVTSEQVAKIGEWLDSWYNHELLKMHALTPWRGGGTTDSSNNELYLLPLTTARPNDPNYNAVSQEIQRMTEAVVSGELSPEEAMAQYRAAVTSIVGEENTVSLL